MESYYSIEKKVCWEQTINKSRFIGVIYPVEKMSEVERALMEVRAEYPNARHYVYAYRLHEGYLEKASDDGEPQGTGGRPVLEALQHKIVWNALLIVVRYFGGILLGTGGLSRAYGGTARQLLEQSMPQLLSPHQGYRLTVPYPWFEKIKYHLSLSQYPIEVEEYGVNVNLKTYIPLEQDYSFVPWLDEFSIQQVLWTKLGIYWRVQEQADK